jgi:hypothetical protein
MRHLMKQRIHQSVSALFLSAALALSGSVVQASRPQAAQAEEQSQSQGQSAISTFNGKVLSQNGERFILRDDINGTWYHLDDQKQAGKFLGKNVSVTGVLDQRTDTIRVRSITEASA